jgi:hypothetical protein
VSVLAAALLAAGGYVYYLHTLLEAANTTIDEQEQIIEQKQVFGAAVGDLVDTAAEFDGVLFHDLVPESRIQSLVDRGWSHRWDAEALQRDADAASTVTDELRDILTAAHDLSASGNVSGTTYEATIDSLGRGFVDANVRADADAFCGSDVLGCVDSDDPYVVHFDATDVGQPYLTDWVQTGVAYHEFAHVLQDTNYAATRRAVVAFDGDFETMADCFALTYLAGWTLDHRIWTSSYQYWDLSVGYGYVCNETQRQAVRDWYESLAYHHGVYEQ